MASSGEGVGEVEIPQEVVVMLAKAVLERVNEKYVPIFRGLQQETERLKSELDSIKQAINNIRSEQATYQKDLERLTFETMKKSLSAQLETLFKVARENPQINLRPMFDRLDEVEEGVSGKIGELGEEIKRLNSNLEKLVKMLGDFTQKFNDSVNSLIARMENAIKDSNVRLLGEVNKRLKPISEISSKIDQNYAMISKLSDEVATLSGLSSQIQLLNSTLSDVRSELARLRSLLEEMGEGGE